MKTSHSSNEGSVIRVRRTRSASGSDYITAQAAQPGIPIAASWPPHLYSVAEMVAMAARTEGRWDVRSLERVMGA